MAQIKNINDAPIVSPDGAYLIALKGRQLSRIDGKALSQDTEVIAHVDAKIKEVIESYKKEIARLNDEIIEIKSAINGIILAAQNNTAITSEAEETEEDGALKTKSKKTKK